MLGKYRLLLLFSGEKVMGFEVSFHSLKNFHGYQPHCLTPAHLIMIAIFMEKLSW